MFLPVSCPFSTLPFPLFIFVDCQLNKPGTLAVSCNQLYYHSVF